MFLALKNCSLKVLQYIWESSFEKAAKVQARQRMGSFYNTSLKQFTNASIGSARPSFHKQRTRQFSLSEIIIYYSNTSQHEIIR
jgi:hypothetical protein